MDTFFQSPSGYDLLDEVGRGGMGRVYRAWDQALDREVAVKFLHERHAPDSDAGRRFSDEARITGRLQHPGIPAVYRVGALADGRPYLAMKLIRGRTLDELIRSGAPLDIPALGEAIGHAVGYAHAQGVIHRDLKPANIMVGAFGEVQVMDWGLAKARGQEPDVRVEFAPRTALQPADPGETGVGSVFGTPGYMAPEQAAGAGAEIDARSDVFGIGAILCALLTGKPPIGGTGAADAHLRALLGDTGEAFARLDACGADPALIALCKRCLAFEPDARPADGTEIARCLAELRRAADERAKAAERERHAADVRAAEQRKRRRAMRWATGAVVAVLLLGVVGTTAGLFRENEAKRAAEKARDREVEQRARAQANNRRALKAADLMAGRVGAGLRPIAGTKSDTVAAALDGARTVYDELLADPDPPSEAVLGKARLLSEFSDLYRVTRRTRKAKEAAEEAIALYDRLLAGDADADGTLRLERAEARLHLGRALVEQGYGADALAAFRRGLAECEAAGTPGVSTGPERIAAAAHTHIGAVLQSRGDYRGAGIAYDAAVVLHRELAAREPDNWRVKAALALALDRYAELASARGDGPLMALHMRESRRIKEAWLAAEPQSGEAASMLIGTLNTLAMASADPAERAECKTAAREVQRRYPNADEGNVSVLRERMRADFVRAAVPADAKSLEAQRAALKTRLEAIAELRRVIAGIVGDDPDNYGWLADAAGFDVRLADIHLALAALGDDPAARRAKARDLIEASVALSEKISARDPEDFEFRRESISALFRRSETESEPAARFARFFEANGAELGLHLGIAGRYPDDAVWDPEFERIFSNIRTGKIGTQWTGVSGDPRVVAPLVALARLLAERPSGWSDGRWAKAARVRIRIAEFLADVDAAGHLPADARALRAQYPKVALVAKTPAGPVALFDPKGKWQAFAPDGGRFRISLPGVPTRVILPTPIGDVTIDAESYSLARADGSGVTILICDYPPALFVKMAKNLPGTFDGIVAGTIGTGKLLTREELAYGTHKLPGRDFTYDDSTGQWRGRVRAVLLGNRLIVLSGFGKPDFVVSDAVNRVFDSFEVPPPEIAPPPRLLR